MRTLSTIRLAAAALAAVLAAASPAAAQVGAIGGAPGGVVSAAESAARAPILGESGLTLPAGAWTGSALIGVTSGGFELPGSSIDYTFTQLLLGAFYAPTERAIIGVTMFPYASFSVTGFGETEEQSGRADATLYGKYQLWNTVDGRTSIAGVGTLRIPVGDDVFGAAGAALAVGGFLSHSLPNITLHGGLAVRFPFDDDDGETVTGFSAAAVFAASPAVSLSAELLGSTTSFVGQRFTSIELAPGARVRVGSNVHVNGALQFNVSTSPGDAAYDYALVLGASLTR